MRVVMLAPPRVQSLDIVGPAEIFWEAARRLGDPTAYEVQIMGTCNEPVCGTGALRFLCERTIFDPDEPIDTLLVGGDPSFQEIDPNVTAWLARRAPGIRPYGSICTGVFLLAAAGLLKGQTVTTHWECAEKLQAAYPNLKVDADKIFIQNGRLSTAAGGTAGMDLALALVEEDYGRDLALIVARYMVMFLKRPGGQSQFSAHLVGQMSERSPMQTVVEHVLANLRMDHSVEVLAKRARMSTRNFARVFRRELDMTPTEFVESARSDAARRMLQDTAYPLQHIATVCGFGTVGSMRRVFVRNLGLRPLDYRQAFRSALRPEPPKPRGRAKGQASSTAVLM
jgi:transcriptional regulator GlxA family with amidase domain